jgi:hypothetical protein
LSCPTEQIFRKGAEKNNLAAGYTVITGKHRS